MGFQGDKHALEGTTQDISGHFRHTQIQMTGKYEYIKSPKTYKSSFVPVIKNLRGFPNKKDSKDEIKFEVVKF